MGLISFNLIYTPTLAAIFILSCFFFFFSLFFGQSLLLLLLLLDHSVFLHPPFSLHLSFHQIFHIIIMKVFSTSLADGFFLLELELLQVSSSLKNSFQYSGWSQWHCSLDGLHSSLYFQVLQSLYQSFYDCTECTDYN